MNLANNRIQEYNAFIEQTRGYNPQIILTIGSSKTSTIPGVSIAGATPELTLTTPGLDSEYLIAGKVLSMDIIPVTPTGIPTPAVVTRAVVEAAEIPVMVIDAGSHIEPKIPRVVLPSKSVGGFINQCNALPESTARNLYSEAYLLGKTIASPNTVYFLGESIPGGTTLALGILEGLGYSARGKVSSAGPENPHSLKWKLVREGLEICNNRRGGCRDPYTVVSCVGDPVHITIAGIASALLDRGLHVVLSGGTQMAAVLALLARLKGLDDTTGRLMIATTRWLVEDPSSDIVGLVEMIEPRIPIAYYNYDFKGTGYEGLEAYEKGYVKEGVAIGGSGIAAALYKGLSREEIHRAILSDYIRLLEESRHDR